MLTELSVANLKSWKRISQMRLAPITGLFGTNSSGKTSILQLLLMLKQTVESSDRSQVLDFGDDKSLTNLGSFRDVVYRHEKPSTMEFSVKWGLPKQLVIKDPETKTSTLFSPDALKFSCSLSESTSDRPAVSSLTYDLGEHCFRLNRKGQTGTKYILEASGGEFRFLRTQGRVWDLPAPVKFYGFPEQVYAYYQNAGFLSELQLAFESLFGQVYYLGPLREFPLRYYAWKGTEPADMGRRGERVVDAMLAARQRGPYLSPGRKRKRQTLDERIAYWLKELGLIHDFRVEAIAKDSSIYQVKVRKSPGSAEVLITDVGFGVSQVLPVLVLCYYVPEGSIILLEQPEIHLHPSVQSGLADVFIDAIKTRHIQIILESHSEHLLKRLQRRIADQTIRPDETSLYFCEPGNAGSRLTTLDVDIFGNIRNWPKDFFGDEFGEMAAITRGDGTPQGDGQVKAWVVDTNVPIVANGHSEQADAACVLSCLDALENVKRGRIVLDDAMLILDEYRNHLSPSGQPGAGDLFMKWVWNVQANETYCEQVHITPRNGNAGDFGEFPDDPDLGGFDLSDRKFVAVALASQLKPTVINAVDSDWAEKYDALTRCGVNVQFLCPQHVCQNANRRR